VPTCATSWTAGTRRGSSACPTGASCAFLNTGLLPAEFRDRLGVSWSPAQERRFRRTMRFLGVVYGLAPVAVRNLPFNLYLRDLRRRVRSGRRLV
jgi:uncharacterized protein (DUF2236 family)